MPTVTFIRSSAEYMDIIKGDFFKSSKCEEHEGTNLVY